jgi:hypothetical protein
MFKGLNILAISATIFALTAPAMAADLPDCTYKGKIGGKTATIVVKGGQPVSYKYGSYSTKKVSMEGSTISIDQAAIENLSVGATQSGKAAFQGKWQFSGRSSDVTFICG